MPGAYVLIHTDAGAEDYVFKQLKTIKDVKQVYVSYGVYDLIVEVKAENMEDLKEIVTYKIRSLDKIRSTLTLTKIE